MIEAQPSRTAFRVALRRAAHQLVDDAPLIFPDPYAVPLLGPEGSAELGRVPPASRRPFSAAMRAWVVARARFAEDLLLRSATHSFAAQYLLLGAGLDTFALRNSQKNVQVYEVDHPSTQRWKQNLLQAAGFTVPPSARLVAVDFEAQQLMPALQEAGFSLNTPTVVAWLGVVPYLTHGAFVRTCESLAQLATGSELTFDYSQPRAVLSPVEQLMHDSLAERVAQAGEPFRLFFTPDAVARALQQHGFTVVDDLGSAELNQRYFDQRVDGLRTRGAAGRLCHAQLRIKERERQTCENRSGVDSTYSHAVSRSS